MNINMKKEIKLALVLDNHKLKHKESLWKEALANVPNLEMYEFVKEKKKPGPYANTTSLIRYFKLKEH